MRILLLLIFVLVLSFPASSQAFEIGRDDIDKIANEAHAALAGAKLRDGSIITQEQVDELEYPLIPYKDIEQAVLRGFLSGLAQICHVPWEDENFFPYMRNITVDNPDWTDYQLTYVSLLHGFTMGYVEQSENKPECTDQFRANIKKMMGE